MNGLFRKKAICKCWLLLLSFSFFQSLKCENLQAPASEPHLWDMYKCVYDVTAPVAFYAHSAHTSDPFFTLLIAIPPSQYQVELQVRISIHSAKNGNSVIYSHSSCSKPAWISSLEHDIQQKKEIHTGSLPYLNRRCLCLIKKAAVSEQ